MSVTTRQLRAVARRHPVAEKLLVAAGGAPPQSAVTLRDRLAREGTGWIGFREASVDDLAAEAAEPALAEEDLRPLPRTVQLFLVQELSDRLLLEGDDGYFAGLPPGASLYRAVRGALSELRLAGLRAGDLSPGSMVSEAKGRDLRRLAVAYEERLEREGWVDRARLLRLALRAVREGRAREVPVLLVPGHLPLSFLGAELLDAWPAGEKGLLGWAGDRGVDPGPGRAVSRLSGFRPVEADGTEGDPGGADPDLPHRAGLLYRSRDLPEGAAGDLELELALGFGNEVRSVLRRVLEEGLPLDRVEVAYTDGQRYRSLLASEAGRFGFEVTFAEGLPVGLTRPGQALALFYDWILEDHDDRLLRRMMRSGLLDFRRAGLELSLLPTRAAALLREAKIGRGRRRYGEALGRLERRTRARLERREEEGESPGRLRRTLEEIEELGRLVHPADGLLWELAPGAGEVPVGEVAAAGVRFLDRLAARQGRLEPPAHESLARRLGQVAREVRRTMPARRAVRLLRDEIELHPISRSGPRPGCLHAAPVEEAGHSGRPHLFVVGLDEGGFPGAGVEDPILLDREREALSRRLPRTRRRPTERQYDLARALGEADGRVTMLASIRDVADDRELYPGSAFLQAWRVRTGDPDAGFEACLEALSPPTSFVPAGGSAAGPAEAWLARPDRGTDGYLERVRAAHPPLARGREAEAAREGPAFTVHDGRVRADPEALDPRLSGEVVSPSRLETLVESPFRYFLRYVLGLAPVEELDAEPGRWLTPLERGSLLHELFHAFMEDVAARGERPDADRHRPLMRRHVERLLGAWRDRLPPPTDGAFRREAREIRATAGIFLRDEADRADEAEPVGFEVRFGRLGGRRGEGPLDSPEPVELELGEAGPLKLRGSIDRVDRLDAGGYRVWDYKTGSTSGHGRVDPLADGHLQWLLYGRALEVLLERAGLEGDVRRSGYLFPGERGHGERMDYAVDGRATERLADLLARRLDLVAAGLFPHATDTDACRWCDFTSVCGGVERRAKQAARKVEALGEAAAAEGAAPGHGDGPDGGAAAPAGDGADRKAARRLLRWADG